MSNMDPKWIGFVDLINWTVDILDTEQKYQEIFESENVLESNELKMLGEIVKYKSKDKEVEESLHNAATRTSNQHDASGVRQALLAT